MVSVVANLKTLNLGGDDGGGTRGGALGLGGGVEGGVGDGGGAGGALVLSTKRLLFCII